METLYIFNPENDLALANGDENYVSPYSVRKMAQDLFTLPAWYAPGGSMIWIPEENIWKYFYETRIEFLFGIKGVLENKFSGCSSVFPWGWNPSLIKWLRNNGISEIKLPDKTRLQWLRLLSHRAISVKLLQSLKAEEDFDAEAIYLTSLFEVRNFMKEFPACVLKAPWSSSGKGLLWYKGNYNLVTERWCKKVLATQNGIVGMPLYNKVIDFAMEFFVNERGEVVFAGYSLFQTDAGGCYRGNLLASDEQIEKIISTYVDLNKLLRLKKYLRAKLSDLLENNYRGYLGIDMMIYKDRLKGEYWLHPCMEMNLRMNMGMVSRLFYRNYVYPDCWGWFKIDYSPEKNIQLIKEEEESKKMPLIKKEKKIYSGYCSLTPVNKDTHYRAAVWLYSNEEMDRMVLSE